MNQVVAYIQTGLLAGVLVLLACVLVGMPDGLSHLQAAPPETRVDLLSEPLNRLRSALDSLPERLRSAMPGELERRPVVENTELSRLTAQLARLERVLRQRPGVGTTVHAREASQPPAWDRIAPLVKTKATLKDADLKSFKRSFYLLDESELVARYGVPNSIIVTKIGMERWQYRDAVRELYLSFDLHRGRVVNTW